MLSLDSIGYLIYIPYCHKFVTRPPHYKPLTHGMLIKNISYLPVLISFVVNLLFKINNIIFNNYYYKTTSVFDLVFECCLDIKTDKKIHKKIH